MSKIAVTPREFVEEFYLLKQSYMEAIVSSEPSVSEVATLLHKMRLSEEQQAIFAKLLNAAITDVLYTVLLGLDGAAQIGIKQVNYTVLDENGSEVVCGDGEVEALAYDRFHGTAS